MSEYRKNKKIRELKGESNSVLNFPVLASVVSIESHPILALSIEELELSVPSENALKSNNINSIEDLVQKKEQELLKIPDLGKKRLVEINTALSKLGLQLGMLIAKGPPKSEKLETPAKTAKGLNPEEELVLDPISIESHPILALPIQSFLSTRAYNALKDSDIKYLGDLVQKSKRDLLRLSNYRGIHNVIPEIQSVLSKLWLQLETVVVNWPPVPEQLEAIAEELISEGELILALDSTSVISIKSQPILVLPIKELDISIFSSNILRINNIYYLGDLVQKSEEELLSFSHFGRKSLPEIQSILSELGLQLGMLIDNWPPAPEKLEELEEQARKTHYKILDYPILIPREEKILRMRFGIGGESLHTYKEIGLMFNLSAEKIQQIEKEALRKLYNFVRYFLDMDIIISLLKPKYVLEEVLKRMHAKKKQDPASPYSTEGE